jgi:hypothetical protein
MDEQLILFLKDIVKNVWSNTSTSPYIFMACSLIKYMDNFTALDP